MAENDGKWWDTIPKELVDELHIRQHPYHNPKKPRPECPLCWEKIVARKARLAARPIVSDEPKSTYQPPLKRLLNAFRYWNEEIE